VRAQHEGWDGEVVVQGCCDPKQAGLEINSHLKERVSILPAAEGRRVGWAAGGGVCKLWEGVYEDSCH